MPDYLKNFFLKAIPPRVQQKKPQITTTKHYVIKKFIASITSFYNRFFGGAFNVFNAADIFC
jgi:hypothetical protein